MKAALPCLAFALLLLPVPLRAEPTPPAVAPSSLFADFPGRVLVELNRVRAEPGRYADFLETRRTAYREDKRLVLPGQPALRTQEGVAALDEAVAALRALTGPLPVLTPDERLTRVARELADDQAKTGATGHTAADGGTMTVRMARQGQVEGTAGENVAYGAKTAEEIVFSLVVDDGVIGRGHRLNILNADLRLVGVAGATHPKWGQVCVMDLAQGWR